MGNVFAPNTFTPNDCFPGQSGSVIPMCLELGYQRKDIDRMYRVFNKFDTNRDGLIGIEMFLHTKWSKDFGRMLYAIFDEDQSETVNFEEFLVASYLSCSFSSTSLFVFALRVHDRHHRENLSGSVIKFLINLIWGVTPRMYLNIFRDLQSRIDKSNDGNLTLPEFISFLKAFPKCLLPLNRYQHELRSKTLGLKSWAKITERRGVSYGNKILMNILLNLKNKPEALKKGFSGEDLMRRVLNFQKVLKNEWILKKFDPEASFRQESTS